MPAQADFCCITTQQMLSDITGANTPSNIVVETNGFLQAVMSEENTGGFEQVQSVSLTGKAAPSAGNRKLFLEYRQRNCDAVVTTAPAVCTPQVNTGNDILNDTVNVTLFAGAGFRMQLEDFRQLCDEPNDRQQRLIVDKINMINDSINTQLITAFAAGFGNYADGVDSGGAPVTLLPFNTSGQTNAQALNPLMYNHKRSGYSGAPMIVGDRLFDQYAMNARIFVNNDEGYDQTRAGNPRIWSDFKLSSTIGGGVEHAVTWVPGYVQMLEWYDYQPGTVYEMFKPDYSYTTIEFNGMTYDFAVEYSQCDKVWDIFIGKHFDLWKVPADAFNATCDQVSNGCLDWLVDCGDLDCNYLKLIG